MSRWSVDLRRHGAPEFLAAHPICALCHHPIPFREDGTSTGNIDHIIPPELRPDLRYDPRNWQAAHGIAGCPICPPNRSRDRRRRGRPIRCNQARGNKPVGEWVAPVGREW